MTEEELNLKAVIGFKGSVGGGLILHPDNEHLIFPLGCTIVVRNVIQRTQSFLQGHDNHISCLSLSKSGKYLASGQQTFMGFNADIIVWDFERREEMHRLSLHKVLVGSMCFSPNDLYLATLGGQDDNSLVIWNVESGVAICGTPANNETARCVRFFHGSDLDLVTCGNLHVTRWSVDLVNKKLRPTNCKLGMCKRKAVTMVVDQDDSAVYCGTETGDMLEIGMERCLFKKMGGNKVNYSQGITASVIMRNGDIIAGTGTGIVVKFSAKTLKVARQLKTPLLGGITSITLTADETHMFVGTSQSNMYWMETDSFASELRNTCHFERINQVIFPRGYSGVFATCSLSDIRVWNAKSRTELLRIQVPNMECYAMVFTPDGKTILTAWSDGKIRAFLPQSGRLNYVINDAHKGGCTAVASTSDCGRIVSGGIGGEVRVWKMYSQTQVLEGSLSEHRGRVYAIAITNDDKKAFTSSADGSCILWDLDAKSRSMCLFESTMFKALVYHPDESQVLTTGSDRKITYWDTFDGQAIRILEGSQEAEVATLSMAASGSHFVSGSADRLVKFWNYDTGLVEAIGAGHSGTVNSVAISPDQSFAVSVGDEGAIFLWDVPAEASAAMRDMSALEQ